MGLLVTAAIGRGVRGVIGGDLAGVSKAPLRSPMSMTRSSCFLSSDMPEGLLAERADGR